MILRPATRGDCFDLAPRLRECDRQEIAKGSGRVPLYVLQDAVAAGFAQAICTEVDLPVAIWGVVRLTSDLGSIWMLGSPEIESVSLPFLRACLPSIEAQHESYPTLVCASWRGNDLHHRWLRWLGFQEDGQFGEFIRFVRHV